jgi:DNA-binding NarL/FixJ family response regulator
VPEIRILVVDDLAPWRHAVRSMIGRETEWHVVGEASDGLEAIQKAEQLNPDLVLLDIGLPRLNGIDAARQIRSRSPETQVLFLSQETSFDVAMEALKIGTGFVVKTAAAKALLPALKTVIQDRQLRETQQICQQPRKTEKDRDEHYY